MRVCVQITTYSFSTREDGNFGPYGSEQVARNELTRRGFTEHSHGQFKRESSDRRTEQQAYIVPLDHAFVSRRIPTEVRST